ncbi:sugar phosphate isomerase/epimerase, partial [Agrobacterium tumefaciens]|uniref:sugar phosphate isomerase/epimerase family protein n=1 Tax=Agrobacterium tumefaciens TaxID=358 RepID=UPI0015745765|nr:sugar phosphate isomerase/epimerase [Agrobacterium tumefaciens]NTE01559.1 sugar phosphate isomerase/epimerase [Agrobacterium tumefaciens]
MSKQVPDLLASYFTLAGDIYPFGPTEISPIPFRDRVEAAAKAGWKGVGLIHADVKATADKIGYSEMRKIVEGAGIKHLEIEFLGDWYKDGEARAASDKMRHELFQMAEELKIRDIKIAPGLGSDLYNPTKEEMTPDVPRMAEAFAGISREAAEHGTGIALEIMPFSNVRTLEVALAIVEQADQPNCGLLIDIWHMARGGISYDEVAKIPLRHVSSIELDDADQDVIGQLWEDTIYRRKLPGEG